MIDIRFFLLLVAWVLLVIGFSIKSYPVTAIAGMFLMVLGVHFVAYGLPHVESSLLLNSLSFVNIAVGGFVFVKGTWEQYKNY
jgi:hypothetical protein